MNATEANIVDQNGLRLVGFTFGGIALTVAVIALLLVREHLQGRLHFLT